MSEWTTQEVESFAARFGLTWLDGEFTPQLQAAMTRAAEEGKAVARLPDEFHEPASVFAGPGA